MNWVLDTNIILYHLADNLQEPLPKGQRYISIISEIELLSYPGLSASEEQLIHNFLEHAVLIDLSLDIRKQAILLRRQHNLKLPDAVIVATAMQHQATLLTNDKGLVRK